MRATAALALLVVLGLATGCAADPPEGGGPAPAPSAPPSSAPTGPAPPEGTDLLADDVPVPAVEVCGAFAAAYAALAGVEQLPADPGAPAPAGLVEAFRALGADLAAADRPADLTADEADGLAVTSRLLVGLPDGASATDLQALEDGLDNTEERQVDAFDDFVERVCGLEAP